MRCIGLCLRLDACTHATCADGAKLGFKVENEGLQFTQVKGGFPAKSIHIKVWVFQRVGELVDLLWAVLVEVHGFVLVGCGAV